MKAKVKGRALAILISLAMVFTMMPMMGEAAYAKQNTKKTESVKTLNGKGDGTESKTYQISTYAELKEFAEIVNGTHETIQQDTGACAILTDDIECTDKTWVPIGAFEGIFDGDGHIISGLRNGLFSAVDGKVQNVGLKDVNITGDNVIGAVAGYNQGIITNCYSTGSVSGRQYVGGVVGWNHGTITNCYNTGSVSGRSHIGGVVGDNAEYGIISNCYNVGSVEGVIRGIGGVAGKNTGTIDCCYYDKERCTNPESAVAGVDDTDTVKGMTTAEMTGTDCIAYNNWENFSQNWCLTDKYPLLRGFVYTAVWLDGDEITVLDSKEYLLGEKPSTEKIPTKDPDAEAGNTYTFEKWDNGTLVDKTMTYRPIFTVVHNHKYGEWMELDAAQHQRECKHDKTHVEKANHTWDVGVVTKPATKTATGVKTYTCTACKATKTETIAKLPDPEKQYGTDGTPVGPGASIEAAEKAITNTTSDKDIKGATFAPLKFKSSSQGKTNIKLSWTKSKKAAKYVVYGNLCNAGSKKYKPVKLLTVNSSTINIKKIGSAKVKKGTYYKFVIVAIDKGNKVVSTSKTIHVTTKGGKTGNYKSVTIKAKVNAKGKAIKKAKPLSKTVLKKGRSLKLIVKMNPAAKKLKVKKHVGLRYETTNAKVATVSGNKIKAKGKGKCYVYAYTQNGVAKAIKITVK